MRRQVSETLLDRRHETEILHDVLDSDIAHEDAPLLRIDDMRAEDLFGE